nr:SAM and MBT domain containing protein [Hymenolepis microstoma]
MKNESTEIMPSLSSSDFDEFSAYNFSMETGCEIAPVHLFRHIEKNESLNFRTHQIVEMDLAAFSKTSGLQIPSGSYFWPCEVLCAINIKCKFRWLHSGEINPGLKFFTKGADRIPPFWLNVDKKFWELVRPMGYCQEYNLDWISPHELLQCKSIGEILDRKSRPGIPDFSREFEKRVLNSLISPLIFNKKAMYLRDMLKVGDYLECRSLADPSDVWPVKILKHYNGRLVVSWLGINAEFDEKRGVFRCGTNIDCDCLDQPVFSIFLWDPRIRMLGYSYAHSIRYRPPKCLMTTDAIEIGSDFIQAHSPFHDVLPWNGHLFFAPDPPKHLFKVGTKLEAFDNSNPFGARPATVVKILSDRYFIVRFDVLHSLHYLNSRKSVEHQPKEFVAHVGMPQIMPPNMCRYYGLKLFPPENWPIGQPFNWITYARTLLSESKTPSNLPSYLHITEESFQTLIKSLSIPIDRFFNSTAPKSKHSEDFPLDTYSPLRNIGMGGGSSGGGSNRLKRSKCTELSDNSGLWVSRDFCPGMRLEMVLPPHMWRHTHFNQATGEVEFRESPIVTATVIRCQAGLLWLLPDLLPNWSPYANQDYTVNTPIVIESSSTSLYPLGWSQENGHPFIPPAAYLRPPFLHISVNPLIWKMPTHPKPSFPHVNGVLKLDQFYSQSEVCPKIYINSKCYCGPNIVKTRLQFLQREFGPGPLELTLVRLINNLAMTVDKKASINRAFDADWVKKSVNVFCNGLNGKKRREVKAEAIRRFHAGMNLVTFSFRCPNKGTQIPITLEICRRVRAVDDFLRQVSISLEACPFLLSTQQYGAVGQECPLKCHDLINSHRNNSVDSSNNFVSPIIVIADDTIISTAALLNSELRISKGNSKRPLIVSSRLLNDRSLLPPLLYDWNPSGAKNNQGKGDEGKSIENPNGQRPAKRLRGGSASTTSNSCNGINSTTSRKAVKARSNFRNINGDSTPAFDIPTLASDPISWTPQDLEKHLEATNCMELWPWLAAQAVDGQAIMLLPSAQELQSEMGLDWEMAVKIARLADGLRLAYRKQYCSKNAV